MLHRAPAAARTELRIWTALLAGICILAPGCADERASDDMDAAPDALPQDPGAQVDTLSPAERESFDADQAVAVIRGYYAAIDRRDYTRAYAQWADNGAASGQSFEDFRRGFSRTESVAVVTGEPSRVEPAAGSRYVRVPVEIGAQQTDGTEQCFRGSYTLIRSVVTGANAEQQRWHIYSADVRRCGDEPRVESPEQAVRSVVERFGARLARVSLLASADVLREQIRAEYGPLVTPSLLASSLNSPATAPGRAVSSPWPDRIEIERVRRIRAGAYEVVADVVYVTSVDVAPSGAARRERAVLTVVLDDQDRWRIEAYEAVTRAAGLRSD